MTNHSESTGQKGSEGDSEQKKWGQKRQQFDAVVSSARFNGAVDGLVNGTIDVDSLIALLDELNSVQAQRGRYMAEILALKVESRRLATVPFHESVAEFLIESSRRIPWLSDGLASQLAVALASASDNPAYVETVNTAVSNLLLDVTRPLKPDTRNYLRALTDKMLASRRLQEARGHLAIVPSVYPAAIPQQLEQARSLEASQTGTAQPAGVSQPAGASQPAGTAQASTLLATAATVQPGGFEEYERSTLPSGGVPQAGLVLHGAEQVGVREPVADHAQTVRLAATAGSAAREHAANAIENHLAAGRVDTVEIREQRESSPKLQATPPAAAEHSPPKQTGPIGASAAASSDSAQRAAAPERNSSGSVIAPGKTAPGIGIAGAIDHSEAAPAEPGPVISSASTTPGVGLAATVRSVPPAPLAATESGEDWDDLDDDELESERAPSRRKVARGIPVWVVVVAAGAIAASAIGVWALTREGSSDASDATASTGSAVPAGSDQGTKQAKKPAAAIASGKPSAPTAVAPNPPAVPPPPPATPAAAPPSPPAATPAPAVPQAAPVTPSPTPALPAGRGTPKANATPAGGSGVPSKPGVGSGIAPTKPAPVNPAPINPAPTPVQPSTKPAAAKPSPETTAEAPNPQLPGTPRTPTPSRTVDEIIAELRQIPNDGAVIEAKAHEVARIVARSVRKEAEIILQRLIPEEVLAGTEAADTRTLEPVRCVVALLLKKVALDKDDNRAALAIDTLGEWAKLRKHGAAAKLTLDELAGERVVLSRPVRLRALERVQSRLGMSDSGE